MSKHETYNEYGETICLKCHKRWEADEEEPPCLTGEDYIKQLREKLNDRRKMQ